jgi:alpha-N-arabinofuranosidase
VTKTRVHLDSRFNAGPVDPRIFGGFLEHLGRAVYGGVFDPASALSDERGFRRDVADALRDLSMPVVRYPGGNFVSAYDWRDGIGPVADRPVRAELAWRSTETNQFGTDEFVDWCRLVGSEPMIAVNLGTGSPAGAAELVEYCNLPGDTSISDLRAANGHPDPHGVKLWCLGNEMDGPWQAGHVPAATYAERALAAARLMKTVDPSIEVVACGSSGRNMPTYMEWDRTVLEYCWAAVDYISAHRYTRKAADDSPSLLAEGAVVDRIIDDYRSLLGYLRARRRDDRQVYLSFDEWNVWYREGIQDGGWRVAPPLLEEVYNFEDALVCAQYLNSFVRNADVVKVACIAQITNVIAPILVRPDGILLQSIYWPLRMMSGLRGGTSLRVALDAGELATGRRGTVPALDAAAALDGDTLTVSLVNRSLEEELDVEIALAGAELREPALQILHHGDVLASNTWDRPDVIRPREGEPLASGGAVRVMLPAPSHAVLRVRGG